MNNTYFSKLLPVPENQEASNLFKSTSRSLGKECKIQSKTDLANTLSQMKIYNQAQSFDNFEPALSDREIPVSQAMSALRDQINNTAAITADAKSYPPANPFYAVKELLDKEGSTANQLLTYFKQMPKGGNLHIHTSASYNMRNFIIDLCNRYKENIYMLNKDIEAVDKKTYSQYSLVYFEQSPAPGDNRFIRLADYVSNIGNLERLIQLYTLTDNTNGYIDAIPYIWTGFNKIFGLIDSILKVPNIYVLYYTRSFQMLMADGIDYCELRAGVTDTFYVNYDFMLNGEDPKIIKGDDDTDPYFITLLKQAYTDALPKKSANELDPSAFQLKLVLTANRSGDEKKVQSAIDKMKKTRTWMQNPKVNSNPNPLPGVNGEDSKFILGFDLVSEEDNGLSTKGFVDKLFDSNNEDLLYSVPLYLHDGESNRYDDDNLYTAYLVGSERFGHGLNLYRSAYLEELVKANQNTLEVCPISNQVLRYIPDIRIHPVYEYLSNGVRCVIASDDPQIFGNDGLSYDFWMLYASGTLDLRAVKCLIKNSYRYSGMNADEAKFMLNQWESKWNRFIDSQK
ncbi:MAG: hypothetical protein J6Z35_01455 [Lachnospiraceae bacterium]|nr:hypothetical protein [Lachnospiraceae bacterium]